jgi:hypothetical protein
LTLRVNQSLAKTAASVNYPSARLPRLTQIDAPFSSRLSRYSLMQKQETTADDDVDFIFDIPVEVAAAVCKYRYGHLKFDWGTAQFTRLDIRLGSNREELSASICLPSYI